jgi:hypothetical protein
MKISIWDILSIVMIVATVIVAMIVAQIFIEPNSGINPFPQPVVPTALVLPTATNTPIRLPPTWTPTVTKAAEEAATATPVLKPTSTLPPTATGFVVPTWTLTAPPTNTPTITRTPTVTRTPTPTSVPFAVSSVQTTVDIAAVTGACPPGHNFVFTAVIFTSASGTVKFHWEYSDGRKDAVQTLTYASASSQGVTTTWALGAAGKPSSGSVFTGWAQIYIDEPNHQPFNKQDISMTCTP